MATQRQDLLKRQLAVHEEAALQIRRELNSFAYISRLPTEILSIIFQYCPCFDPVQHSQAISRAWTVVLHVCQRWRQTAIHTSSLWTTLALPAPLGFVDAALERSKGLLLHVSVHQWGAYLSNSPQSQKIFSQMPRICSLE
ncbi:uncharacterized protein PHACADRAFT_84491, partial [Phanerochaete carnosa HHB-10118-sp]